MSRPFDDDSTIRSVHFDRATHTLRVELESGRAYDFADVPEHVYDELARTPARDAYFRANVRDEYIGVPAGTLDLADLAQERREDALLGPPLAENVRGMADLPDDRHDELRDADIRGSRHTWVVGVIEDDAAAIEVDGRRVTPIPRFLLPADARDGDVLRVTHARSGTRSVFTIETDHDATRLSYRRSADQLREAPPGGAGNVDVNA
jgi:hypothetical protein